MQKILIRLTKTNDKLRTKYSTTTTIVRIIVVVTRFLPQQGAKQKNMKPQNPGNSPRPGVNAAREKESPKSERCRVHSCTERNKVRRVLSWMAAGAVWLLVPLFSV